MNQTLSEVAQGDATAFTRLYDELSPLVFGLARSILRSRAHAEEVAQEVFLEVWRKASNWKPTRGNATTWVLTITRARSIDRVRSEQSARDRQTRAGARWGPSNSDDVASVIELEDDYDEVRRAIAFLSDKQRIVVELAYFQGKTYAEVADELGLAVGTVKTRMRDGLMKMRKHYGVGDD